MKGGPILTGLAFALLLAITSAPAAAENWPRFRGPNGQGHAAAPGLPVTWTADDYAWQAALPGLGHSSPVVWEGRVYVTSADRETAEQTLLCFDAPTGAEQWRRTWAGGPHQQHRTNSFATPTPAVDADAIYLAWKAGNDVFLAARNHQGDELWRRQVAHLDEHHGFGTSPIVVGDVVVLDNQTAEAADSQIVGVDRTTGAPRWTVPCATGKTVYATPCLLRRDGRTLAVSASMGTGVTALDPQTGAVAWNALRQDLPDRCVSSPLIAGDLALVSCGSGNNGKHLIALRTGPGEPQEIYRVTKGVPNLPMPIVTDGLMFLWHDRGIVSCYDAATGDLHWQKRIGGMFHSSPLLVDNRLYCISLAGAVHVLAASDEFTELGKTELGEPVTATPAVADGRMFIRTEQTLYCLVGEAR